MTKTTEARSPLSRSLIVAAAVSLADEDGVDALSMRTLARRLGCGAMSLYNHVTNRDELHFLMVESLAAEIIAVPEDAPPLDAVRAIAVSTHEVLVRHDWAAALWLSQVPGPERTRRMEDLLCLLDQSGLSPELAHHGFHAVTNHVVGYTLQQLGMTRSDEDPEAMARQFVEGLDPTESPYMIAHVRQHLDGDTASSFELVLDLILDGLVRLDRMAESIDP